MDTAIMLFTRDLRLHDNPALHRRAPAPGQVVPLFVLEDRPVTSPAPPNRARFLPEALADLRGACASAAATWSSAAATGHRGDRSGGRDAG